MIKAAEKASKSVIRDFGEVEKLQVSKKGPRDFVTKTDKLVEKILIEELSKTKKNYSFLSGFGNKAFRDIFSFRVLESIPKYLTSNTSPILTTSVTFSVLSQASSLT